MRLARTRVRRRIVVQQHRDWRRHPRNRELPSELRQEQAAPDT
ncbi:hypothetical protein ACFRKE_07065 [Kitasatospora indigofera]